MRERPILFSAPMVRAILAGNKTQTRRVVKVQPTVRPDLSPSGLLAWLVGVGSYLFADKPMPEFVKRCPYGQPGDRLWVRETFAIVPRTAYARSDGVQQIMRPNDDHDAAIYRADWTRSKGGLRWRPSIHMPRWASRILLEITDVRVERLQSISERDAWAEGCEGYDDDVSGGKSGYREFYELWQDINGRASWDANPWVWVVEFKRITP